MGDFVNCKCHCSEKVSTEEREIVFKKFREAGSYEARCYQIGTMVSQGVMKRSGKAAKDKKRHSSRIYTTGICKPFFLQTLHISGCMVHTALSKVSAGCPVKDKRDCRGGHKDTCIICDSFKAQLSNASTEDLKANLKERHNTRLSAETTARDLMKKNMAESNTTIECLTFDLEKTLPLPRIPTNVVYYKRQLMLYNCGAPITRATDIFVGLKERLGEVLAQRVVSCLRQHLLEECSEV
ncbi:hypothetical protein PR048_026071 [Dryococelus australis]|uniref:Uncharacterized protein n=1 Tax=Dryococelus australis TaxID=614101 RepID=A0ABQ9GKA2_9NEOP|nr:hypothetical protein PR048_026071 [Dryococelus australis]